MARPKILFLLHHPVQDASSRYRIYQFVPHLEMAGLECVVRPFSTSTLLRAIRDGGSLPLKLSHTLYATLRRVLQLRHLQDYDLVFIHREAFPFLCPLVEQAIMRRHPRVIFSLDDAVYVGHDQTTMHYPWLYRFKYGSGIDRIILRAALVIAGNSELAAHAGRYTERIAIVPTVVDLERYAFTLPRPPTDDSLVIGWYGSNSTSQYLDRIVPALRQLAAAHPGKIRFRFYGDPRLSLALPGFQAFPFRLPTEIEDLRTIDIGLMPMPDTAWTRAKCAFKAIQYMALGIPTVLTPIGVAAELVQHNQNGLHASTVEQWFHALDRLVVDHALRQRLALAGRSTIEANYSLKQWAPRFAELLWAVIEDRPLPRLPVALPEGAGVCR